MSDALKIFVSSRMKELEPERRAIKTALKALEVDGWVFEKDAGARPQSIQQTYLKEVEDADLYVGVFWKGYGAYTIEEYEHAQKLGKDCLIYEKRADLGGKREPQLQSFLDRVGQVKTGRTIQWFETPGELGELIRRDVAHWQARKIRERQTPINITLSLADKREREQLLILLAKVKEFWIEGYLKQSVHNDALIDLGKETWAGGKHPWEHLLEIPYQKSRSIPVGQPIVDIFDEVGRSLLILGAPGSGKTITMLELTRDLVRRAADDPAQPIPVVFNLSSWAEHRLPLFDWLTEELRTKYRVPKRIGHAWLEANCLLPMLDGLDEVQAEHRLACVKAIDAFVNAHGVPGLATSCRLEEYTDLSQKLNPGGAICLQPLKAEQAIEYVERVGQELAGLALALKCDEELQALAETPLMLSVMSIAYRDADSPVTDKQQSDSPIKRRDQILGLYVDQTFRRKGSATPRFSKSKVIGWLSWLARKMRDDSQSILMVEGLEPRWLGSLPQRASYGALAALFIALIFGLIFGLIFVIVPIVALISATPFEPIELIFAPIFGLIFGLNVGLAVLLGSWSESSLKNGIVVGLVGVLIWIPMLGWPYGPSGAGIYGYVIFGVQSFVMLVFGLIGGVGIGSLNRITSIETMSWNWAQCRQKAISGWMIGTLLGLLFYVLLGGAIHGLDDSLILCLIGGLVVGGLIVGLIFGLIGGAGVGSLNRMAFVDNMEWTQRKFWKIAISGGLIGTLCGVLIFGLFDGLGDRLISWLIFGLIGGLIGLLIGGSIGGMTERVRVEKSSPNEGINLSGRNASIAFVGSIGVGLILGLTFVLISATPFDPIELIFGLIGGLIFGLIGGLIFGLHRGGSAVIKHYSLRLILWLKGYTPFRFVEFLDYCTKLVLLKKWGSGYMFMHRTLLDYFAGLTEEDVGSTAAGPDERSPT